MQFRFFKMPTSPDPDTVEELNRFLRAHRVVQVRRELVAEEGGAYWAICVEYVQSGLPLDPGRRKERVDYREVLSDEAFQVFARLRDWRKRQAETEGVPVYAVFGEKACVSAALCVLCALCVWTAPGRTQRGAVRQAPELATAQRQASSNAAGSVEAQL